MLPQLPDQVRSLLARLFNSAVSWVWAVTAIRLANFVIILPIALKSIPSEEMGIWYLMLNIVAAVTLLEFGMCAAFSRQASFQSSHASSDDPFTKAEGLASLHSLILLAGKIYLYLSFVVGFAILCGGIWLAMTHPHAMMHPLPLISYAILGVSATIRMGGLHWNPFLFGLQKVRDSQQIQFTGVALSYVVILLGLFFSSGILALALGQCVALIYPMLRSRHVVLKTFPDIFLAKAKEISWKPIWFSTWQTGLILLGGWLSTQGLILASGQTTTLETAASFSICVLVALTIHSLAQGWLVPKYPTISYLWITKERDSLQRMIASRLLLSLGTYFVAAIAAWILLPELLLILGSKTYALPTPQLALLLLIFGIDLFIGSHSAILISCNEFPHTPAALLCGIITITSAFYAGYHYGIWGILLAAIICQVATTAWIVPMQCWKLLRK